MPSWCENRVTFYSENSDDIDMPEIANDEIETTDDNWYEE